MELWRAIRDREAAGWTVAVPHVCISRPGEVLYWTTASELEVRAEFMGTRPTPARLGAAMIFAGGLAVLEFLLTIMGRVHGIGELNPIFRHLTVFWPAAFGLRIIFAAYPFLLIWWLGRRGSEAALWLAGMAAGVAAAGCAQWIAILVEAL